MNRFVTAIIILLALPATLLSQPNLKELNQFLEQMRKDWGVPGMSVAIVKDGEVVLNKGYGVKEAGSKDRVDENTLFAIASNTKAFVSSALATLVSEGKINWDDPVRQYLPYFELYDPYVSYNLTIRDLLCHRSGLGTFSGDVIWYKSERSAEEIVKRAKHVPQVYPFRSGYGYSNLMFITAGEVIKAVTGMVWHSYVAKTFFAPLDMDRTIASTNDLESMENFATPHKPGEDNNQPIRWVNWDNMGAAGGLISSSTDMAKWVKMNLENGIWEGDTLLQPAQQNILWTPHNNFVLSAKSKEWIGGRHFSAYGLGWGLSDYHGRMLVTHSGGYDGMYSRVALMPDENLGIVILTNGMSGLSYPMMLQIINEYIQADDTDWNEKYLNRKGNSEPSPTEKRKLARNADLKPQKQPTDYVGTYSDPFYGEIRITSENESLSINFETAPALSATLTHWHGDTYQINWNETHAWFDFGTVQFVLDNNLEVIGIEFDVPNYDIFFDEIHAVKSK